MTGNLLERMAYNMSCHDIGRGMNFVSELISEMYDTGEISKESAVKIFRRLQKGCSLV